MFLSDFPAIFPHFSSMFDMKSIPSAPPSTPMAHGTCPPPSPPSPPSPSSAPPALCAAPGAAGAHGTAPRRRGRTPRNGRRPLDGEFFEENGEKNMETMKKWRSFINVRQSWVVLSIFFVDFWRKIKLFYICFSYQSNNRLGHWSFFRLFFVQNRSNAWWR